MAIIPSLKRALFRGGISEPLKNVLLSRINTGFFSLSPDLMVAMVKAFDQQTSLEGRAYYEFGLFRGYGIWFAEQITRGKRPEDFLFYGFDSFQGLPRTEVDRGYYRPGQFRADYQLVTHNLWSFGGDLDRIKLFRGYYSKESFEQFKRQELFRPVSIAVIDVKIYESCVEALDFLQPYLVAGSILILAGYNDMERSDGHGARRALREFEARTGMEKELMFEAGRTCCAFWVTKAPD